MPTVCIQKPRSGLRPVCKSDTIALYKLRLLNDDERRAITDRSVHRLNVVDQERQFYKSNIDLAKETIKDTQKMLLLVFKNRVHLVELTITPLSFFNKYMYRMIPIKLGHCIF